MLAASRDGKTIQGGFPGPGGRNPTDRAFLALPSWLEFSGTPVGRDKVWSGLVGTGQPPSREDDNRGSTLTMGYTWPHLEFTLRMNLSGWASLQLAHLRDVSDKERWQRDGILYGFIP